MVADTTSMLTRFNLLTAGVGLLTAMFGRLGFGLLGLRSASGILGSIGILMGKLPLGTSGFPTAIQRIIQLSAAITLFGNSSKIIASIASRFSLLSGLAPHIEEFGRSVLRLSSPIQTIRRLAVTVGLFVASERLVMGLVGAFGKLAGGIGAVGAVAYVITGLVNAVGQLSGLLGFVPGAMFAAAAAGGVLYLALSGMSKAIKDGGAALAALPPEARAVATEIRALQKPFADLKATVQDRFFAGLADDIKSLAGTYFPLLRTGLANIAQQFNYAAKQVTAFLKSGQTIKDFREGFDLTAGVVHNLATAIHPLLSALRDIGIVGLQAMRDLTGGVGTAAQKFADFIARARETGQLRAWIDRAVQGFRDLWNIVANVAVILRELFTGIAGSGQGFLSTIRQMTDQMRAFMESASGGRVMKVLGDVIDHVVESLKKLGSAFAENLLPVIEKILPLIQQISSAVVDGLTNAMSTLGTIFSALATVLGPIVPLLAFILQHMVTTIVVVAGLGLAMKVLGAVTLILSNGLAILRTAFMVASFAARLLTGNLTLMEAMMLKAAGAMIKQWVLAAAGAVKSAALSVAAAARVVASWVLMGAQATANAVRIAAAWVLSAVSSAASAVAATVSAAARVVAGWVAMAAGAVANAARVAASWLLSAGAAVATAVASTVSAVVKIIAQWVAMAAAATLNAAKVVLAWLGIGTAAKTAAVEAEAAAATVGASAATGVSKGWLSKFVRVVGGIGILLFALDVADDATGGHWKKSLDTAWQAIIGDQKDKEKFLQDDFTQFLLRMSIQLATSVKAIQPAINALATMVGTGVMAILGTLPATIGRIFSAVTTTAGGALSGLTTIVSGTVGSIGSTFGSVLGGLPGLVGGWFSSIVGTITGDMGQAAAAGSAGAQQTSSGIDTGFSGLPGIAANWFGQMWTSITEKISGIMTSVSEIPGKISGFLGGLGSLLWQAGYDIINGLLQGIMAAAQAAFDFVAGIAGKIASLKGPLPYDRVLLIPHGNAIINGLVEGMRQGMPGLEEQIRAIIASIQGTDVRFGYGQIAGNLSDLSGVLNEAGASLVRGLLDGIRQTMPEVWSYVQRIAPQIAALKGPLEYDRRLLIPHGTAIMFGLVEGIRRAMPMLERQIEDVIGAISWADNWLGWLFGGRRGGGHGGGTGTPPPTPTPPPINTWNPYVLPGGPGRNEQAGATYTGPISVTIDAKTIAEMQSVQEFFGAVQQRARAGKAA